MKNNDKLSESSFVSTKHPLSPVRDGSRHRTYWSAVLSGVFFITGSIFYIVLAVADLEYFETAANYTDDQLEADDVVFWDQFYWEADFIFNGDIWVSRAMVVYVLGALSFVFLGVIDLMYRPGFILGLTFVLAGFSGLVAALLYVYNEWVSSIFDAISVHLFFLEAVEIIYFYWNDPESHWILWMGDIMFVGGTFIDVVLSYPALFDTYSSIHANTALAASALWLGASIINMYNVIRERSLYLKVQKGEDMNCTDDSEKERQTYLPQHETEDMDVTFSVGESSDVSDHSSHDGQFNFSERIEV